MLTFDEIIEDRLLAAGPMVAVVIIRPGERLWGTVSEPWPGRPESERDLGAHHERILTDPEDPCDPLETMCFDWAEVKP